MLFSSNLFLFLYLPAVLLVYYLLDQKYRNNFLLCASLAFYAWGTGKFVLIMIGCILFNYVMGLLIYYSKKQGYRKTLLVAAVIGNLSILFFYKYLDFFIANINLLGFQIPLQNIALPLGISFFTFQAMSYTLDIYAGTSPVQKYPQKIALYVSFFPQLVAGPIVRYNTIADQIDHRKETFDGFCQGVKRFIIGFAKKIILSNNMAIVADTIFAASYETFSVSYAWLGALAYSFQIFFDFSGYSDMAIGLGKMFGFEFMENFNYPYISRSVSEFWRRWHISLGQFFRDYVYFPLGGSRVKRKGQLVFNLFVVWFLTGIWHGASWTFIIWGLFYFLLLTFEKLSGYPARFTSTWQCTLYRIFTLLCILFGWVLFRVENITDFISFFKSMCGLYGNPFIDQMTLRTLAQYQYFFIFSALCSTPIFKLMKETVANHSRIAAAVLNAASVPVYLFLLHWSVSYIMMGSHNPFIYFNF